MIFVLVVLATLMSFLNFKRDKRVEMLNIAILFLASIFLTLFYKNFPVLSVGSFKVNSGLNSDLLALAVLGLYSFLFLLHHFRSNDKSIFTLVFYALNISYLCSVDLLLSFFFLNSFIILKLRSKKEWSLYSASLFLQFIFISLIYSILNSQFDVYILSYPFLEKLNVLYVQGVLWSGQGLFFSISLINFIIFLCLFKRGPLVLSLIPFFYQVVCQSYLVFPDLLYSYSISSSYLLIFLGTCFFVLCFLNRRGLFYGN